MAERIMMTPQELNDCAAFIRDRLAVMTQEVTALNNRINDVVSRWDGASRQAFYHRYADELYPVLDKVMPDVINTLSKKLDAAAEAIRDTDAQIAQAFRG